MNYKVLVDTSILLEYIRGKDSEIVELVKELIRNQRIVLCGIVLSELLAGIRAKKGKETLKQTLEALDFAEVSRSTWVMTGEMASTLKQEGVKIPMTDLILAALALENGYELLTKDRHFNQITTLKLFNQTKS